jgi:hypothetical protein
MISDEMVGIAAHQITGLYGATCCHKTGGHGGHHMVEGCEGRDVARAAIEAVAPAIRAEALEEAAKVAEAKAVSYLEQAGYDMSGLPFRRLRHQKDVSTHNSWVSKANAAGSILAAIRAMKEPT